MPRTIQADGRTVQVPDDATPEEVNSIFGPSPSTQAPTPAPQPAGDWRDPLSTPEPSGKRPGLLGRITTAASNIGAGGLGAILHPLDTIHSIGQSINPGQIGDPYAAAEQFRPMVEGLMSDPAATIESGIGQAGALGLAAETAPPVLDAAGSLLKKTGRGVGNVVLGANAADRAYNTRPGAGISENRVIAATRPGLLQKVKAQVAPLTEARDATLAASPIEGMDIRRDVNQPFHDIRTAKTDPVTGGADPRGIANLTMAQKVANLAQDPLTGRPLESPPQLKPLHSMTPLEAGQLNTNLRDMATYNATQPEGTLAEQALKGAGSNIRQSLADAVPESVVPTQQLHDTLGARDVLQRQQTQRDLHPARTLTSMVARNIADPALIAGGSTAASALDLAGSGLKKLSSALRRPVGPPPPSPEPTPQPSAAPPPTPPAGLLPQFAGQQAGEPPMAPTQTTAVNPAQPVRYPNLQGEPQQLPQSATPGFTSPNPKPPPSVSLKERVQPRASGLTPQPISGFKGQGGVGPEGPGQFQITPRRLMSPTKPLTVYHSGEYPGGGAAFNEDRPLFTSTSKEEAGAYGDPNKFQTTVRRWAGPKDVTTAANKIGLRSQFSPEELGQLEHFPAALFDPNLLEEGPGVHPGMPYGPHYVEAVRKLVQELQAQGFSGARSTDFASNEEGRPNATRVIFKPEEIDKPTLKQKVVGEPTPQSIPGFKGEEAGGDIDNKTLMEKLQSEGRPIGMPSEEPVYRMRNRINDIQKEFEKTKAARDAMNEVSDRIKKRKLKDKVEGK